MADFRAFNNPGLQGGASSKHWSGEPMDWSNSLGSRSFSNSQPLYGSKRDLWELGSREAGLEAGKVEAGGEPIKASGKSAAFFSAPHAVARPFVSSHSSQSQNESDNAAAARKNDIFAVSHLVSKPTSKMSQAELDELAHPGTSYSYAQRYTKGTARPDLDTNSPTLTPVPSPDALVQPQPPPQPPSASSSVLSPALPEADVFNRYDLPPIFASSRITQAIYPPPLGSVIPVKGPQHPAMRPRGFVDLDEVLPDIMRKTHSLPQPVTFPHATGSPTTPTPNAGMIKSIPNRYVTDVMTAPVFPSAIITNSVASSRSTIPATAPVTHLDSSTSNDPMDTTSSQTSIEAIQTQPPNLQLTFLPLAKNYLGNGRYAKVFKAHYTLHDTEERVTPTSSTFNVTSTAPSTGGSGAAGKPPLAPTNTAKDDPASIPCAVKQMHATRECFDVARTEARILRMMSGHPSIIELIGTTTEDALEGGNGSGHAGARVSAVSGGAHGRERSHQDDFYGDSDEEEEEEEGCPRMLLVLELAPRGTMMDYIESVQGEGIGQELWMRWAKQLASAVDYVHSFGFVHHDIKPHNCLLTSRKDVKLADFGNALPVQGFQPPQQPVHLLSPGANFTAEPTDIQPSPITTRVNLSPTLSPFHNSVSRDSSSTSCDSRSIRVGSLGPPSPIGFVEKFRSDLENASIRSSRTGSLTDGLGRGTQAYMAPEIFMSTPIKSSGEYSFPVDLYAVGATLYVAATGRAPFTLAPSSVYMMMGIRRGFWASGLQPGFGTSGPDVTASGAGGDANGLSMRQSLANGGGEGGLRRNRWLQEGAGVAGGEGVVKFGNGDPLDTEAVRIMCACLELEGAVRPTARELVVWLGTLGL